MADDLTQALQRDMLGIGGLASDLNAELLDAAYDNLAQTASTGRTADSAARPSSRSR